MAIPTIAKSREGWYLILFSAQFGLCLGLVSWQETGDVTSDTLMSTGIAIGQGMGSLVIAIAASTAIIVEGSAMLAEKYLKRRYTEGRDEERKAWESWNERRKAAERNRIPFNESPPPKYNNSKSA